MNKLFLILFLTCSKFVFAQSPVVYSMSPINGPFYGATTVVFEGFNFNAPISAYFGLYNATVIGSSMQAVTVLSPAVTQLGNYYAYVVSNTNSSNPKIFTYYPETITPTPTNTLTWTPTFTVTNTPTNTPTVTNTPTNTFTFTPTSTKTPTPTATSTPTFLPTFTFTPTNTPTNTPTATKTNTPTLTPTNTPTNTP